MGAAEALLRLEGEAKASIRTAFASSEDPSPSEIEDNHCPECRETAMRFAGRPWDQISVATLLNPRPEISLLTPAAFRYYVPALMLACIEAPRELDVVPDSLIANLSPPNAKATGDTAERLNFTPDQARAIVAFLRVFELRQRLESGLPEDMLEFAPVTRPLARAIRYWTARARIVRSRSCINGGGDQVDCRTQRCTIGAGPSGPFRQLKRLAVPGRRGSTLRKQSSALSLTSSCPPPKQAMPYWLGSRPVIGPPLPSS